MRITSIQIAFRRFFQIGALAIILTACSEDLLDEINVLSERVLFVGSDNIRLSGRILATQDVSLSDHGFEIADNATFTNPERISLGEIVDTGGFLGETRGCLRSRSRTLPPVVQIRQFAVITRIASPA